MNSARGVPAAQRLSAARDALRGAEKAEGAAPPPVYQSFNAAAAINTLDSAALGR